MGATGSDGPRRSAGARSRGGAARRSSHREPSRRGCASCACPGRGHRRLARDDHRMISRLDHVVVAVRDVDAALETYRTLLGRPPSWRAEAHGGGAEIVTFSLANVSVELMAPAGQGPTAERLQAVLDARGEGLASLAFGVDDVDRAKLRLERVGLDPEPIVAGESI